MIFNFYKYHTRGNMKKKDYSMMSSEIVKSIGGKDNISFFTHCVTRLRFNLKDKGLVNSNEIEKIPGVIGCQWVGDQLQIIVGQEVGDVYETICKLEGFKKEDTIKENIDPALKEKKKFSFKYLFNTVIIGTISECVFPIFPIFVGAGIIKMLATILGPNLLNLFSAESDVLTLLNFVGDAGFYYFPVFVAWTAAKRFNTSIPIALFLSTVLVHPTLVGLVTEGTKFTVFGIPMTLVKYSNQLLPSILMVWILSYVYKYIDKICPKSVKIAVVPLCTVLIMLPITLCLLGPIGSYCGILIAMFANWLVSTVGPLAVGLIGGLWYVLVGLGMDKALVPVILNQFANYGYDNLFWLSAIVATYALIGVAIAYAIRSKKEERAMNTSNAITLILGGVSEPTIFGCIFRFKKAMAWLFIGGFIGGIIASILNVKAYTIGTGNFLFFTVCAGGDGSSLVPAIIACVIAFSVSFILGLVFGFTEKSGKQVKENKDTLSV